MIVISVIVIYKGEEIKDNKWNFSYIYPINPNFIL